MRGFPGFRDDVAVGARFLAALPRFLRTPQSIEAMRADVRERFARREEHFLERFAEALQLPGSPYARLMFNRMREGSVRVCRKGAMLLTSLLGSAPVRLLNVCMGDRATFTRRECGCPLDATVVADVFLAALGGGSGGERLMELQWRDGRVLSVLRRIPARTPSGKIVHVASQLSDQAAGYG